MRFWLATCVASLAVVAACGMSSQPAPGTTPSPISTGEPSASAPGTLPTDPPAGGSTAEIELEVIGGEYEGSYRAEAPGACVSEPAANTFTVSYADESASTDFAALHLALRDATEAQEDVSSDFLLEIGLEGAANVISYTLDPTAGMGEGDAFLDITDFDATLDLSTIAADDSIIDLTVICEPV